MPVSPLGLWHPDQPQAGQLAQPLNLLEPFPDSARGCYVLPVKRAVRKAEDLDLGDTTAVIIELI